MPMWNGSGRKEKLPAGFFLSQMCLADYLQTRAEKASHGHSGLFLVSNLCDVSFAAAYV
jgi:hypothetical protein